MTRCGKETAVETALQRVRETYRTQIPAAKAIIQAAGDNQKWFGKAADRM